MKTAKRIILCMLAMVMLASFYCVGSHAYILGGETFEDEYGNALFSLDVSNANIQTFQYTAYAELQKADGANFSVGICFASIYGWNSLTHSYEEYDGDNVLAYYRESAAVFETDVAYFSETGENNCVHSVSMTKRVDFQPTHGKATAIIGSVNDNGDCAIVLETFEGQAARKRIRFTAITDETVSYAWVTGDDGFIQMSN